MYDNDILRLRKVEENKVYSGLNSTIKIILQQVEVGPR
jgi:hypothetical protein